MLASACRRRTPQALRDTLRHRRERLARRTLVTSVTSAVQTLSDGFVDLALALPLPPSWPTYSSTIILTTIATRLVFTVPFSIWAKKRQRRGDEEVLPRLREAAPGVAQAIMQEMKALRIRGSETELREHHRKRYSEIMKQRRNELYSRYRCSPIATMIIPPVSQIPLFVGFSMMLGRLSQPPTPFDSESFLSLTSLVNPDPTATLPIALGLITLANVETSRWFISEDKRLAATETEKKNAERRAKGEVVIEPSKIIQSALRIMSVGRILIGALVPGSVVLYWVTSAVFGLFQTWVFDWWEARRSRLRRRQPPPPPSPPPTSPSSRPRQYTWIQS
ncbi:hypothetical protein OE88DRAFT_1621195 [Heliocybe sulcata]|uniref:Membrane insertase YidC/Oxa/ALB C-terminal domain-containing protein n=1 Tax=Heliocybe sulcata TaxID=5364 RepID=A0A5C3NGF7_9AGAM|nr:hypothetical protein OE88DRAFT_1621195 [Heliocybe sulcata]